MLKSPSKSAFVDCSVVTNCTVLTRARCVPLSKLNLVPESKMVGRGDEGRDDVKKAHTEVGDSRTLSHLRVSQKCCMSI